MCVLLIGSGLSEMGILSVSMGVIMNIEFMINGSLGELGDLIVGSISGSDDIVGESSSGGIL